MTKNKWLDWRLLSLLGTMLMVWLEPSWAAGAGGMPWETPLNTVKDSITGPVAMVISLMGITVAGGMLIFGGELGEFARRIVMLVMVISLLVLASSVMSTLFGGASAVI